MDGGLTDVTVVMWGQSGSDPMTIYGMENGETIPPGALFAQGIVGDEQGTASKIIGDKRTFYGLKLDGLAALQKGDGAWPENDDWPFEIVREWSEADEEIDAAELGTLMGQAVVDVLREEDIEFDPSDPEDNAALGTLVGRGLNDLGLSLDEDELDEFTGKVMAAVGKGVLEEVEVDIQALTDAAMTDVLTEMAAES